MEDRVYYSGLWLIDGNRKKSPEVYLRHLSATLKMISGHQLHFYYDDDLVLEKTLREGQANGIRIIPRRLSIAELPGWDAAGRLLDCCRNMQLDKLPRPTAPGSEKCTAHYWRDFKDGGPEVYRQMLTIWISKIPLMAQAARAFQGDRTTRLSWIDATISRVNRRRTRWDFTRISTAPERLSHYRSPMTYLSRPLPLSAGFLCATQSVWEEVHRDFNVMLEACMQTPYAHDEETILSQCVWADPAKFATIGRPARSGLERRLLRLGMKST